MNTSEGLYDRVTWTIAGEQVESPYTLTIPYQEIPVGDEIGSIQVSNGETDTATAIIKRASLTKIQT